ncbi:MAG: RpiB/LacA/LacB family sugar-phosphate isomerase [Nanoarchaeota archaeon]|nr:RpiB/LacA/LacB family sugar-phosphate isomerase [Nanoarchaeota archaeon]
MVNIIIGCDHAGFKVKQEVFEALEQLECHYEDFGVFSDESIHYPRIAKKVCKELIKEKCKFDFGILICGSGTGMAIAANRFNRIRAALCYDIYSATMARVDNNCNILCLRAREFDTTKYLEIIKAFITSHPSEENRHIRRVKLLDEIVEEEEF